MRAKLMTSLFIIFSMIACENPDERSCWSAFETLSVPYEVRQQELEKGNLVSNFSFEKGQELQNGKAGANFELENWSIVGKNVEWTKKADAGDGSPEACHGERAVKITRTVDDLKEAENPSYGIRSDFIEVIPGNYNFSLDVRLEKVFPSVKRLNARLGQDIDFRLEFYDKDKKQLGNGVYYEYTHNEVDNSFKGFAFSNFYYIERFDWGRVNARTLNYPFSEGDLPDGCFYVKIFLGFKGSGTAWLDNVNFSYSRWNFTPLERVRPLLDREYRKADLIIPSPRKIGETADIPMAAKKVIFVMPQSPVESDITAKNLIARHLKSAFDIEPTEAQPAALRTGAGEIVISLGRNELVKKYQDRVDLSVISGKKQGYVIKRVDDLIFLAGETNIGTFYAATTFVQLFDKDSRQVRFAEIIDYPTFEGRSVILSSFQNEWVIQNDAALSQKEKERKIASLYSGLEEEAAVLDHYAFYKINKVYNNYGNLPKNWWDPGRYFEEFFRALGKAAGKYGGAVRTAVMLNPYYHFEYEAQEDALSDELRGLFSHSDPQSLEKIKKIYRMGLDNGAGTLMLCADDFVPHAGTTRGEYTLFTDQDKKQFYNLAHAQAYLISEILNWLDKEYKGTRFEFCPAPYLNQFIDNSMGSAEAFFRDLTSHLPADVAIIWTGNTVRSLAYDHADIRRYTSHIKRKPMIWDNTPYARYSASNYGGYPALYPGKAVMCNLFEPHDISYPKDFAEHLEGHYYSNLGGNGEINKIQYLSFADFTWNLDAYNPDFSLVKALVASFGKENALKLLEFNERYFALVSIWSKIRNGKKHQAAESPYVIDKSLQAEAGKIIDQLNDILSRLQSIENKKLKEELGAKLESIVRDYRGVIQDDKVKSEGQRQT